MPSVREPLWDNARWVAMALVVVGHSIEVPSRNNIAFGVYLTIYTFHMPLFAFISGRFSRAEPMTVRSGGDLLRRLIAPLVVFQLLYALAMWHYNDEFLYNLARPIWHLWFIPALLLWRLTLPLFAALRWPVLASLVVACSAGLWPSSEALGWISRTFAFVPFFVAGWAWQHSGLNDRLLRWTDRWLARVLAAAVLVGTAVVAVESSDWAREHRLRPLVQGEHTYEWLGYQGTQWFVLRLAAVVAGMVLLGCTIVLVSRRERFTTAWGQRTMTIFLIHLFPILVAEQEGWISRDRDATSTLVLLVLAALAWTAVLSMRWVDVVTGPLVHPRLRWLLAARPDESARRMVTD